MNNKSMVSIALATFNGEKYISRQMESLLRQDYPSFEIVISDDCSTDGTWDILQSYAKRDGRIRLLPRDVNRGYVKNFIRVFAECRGRLISPCDQDDVWYEEKVSRLVDGIGDAALIYCNSRFVNADGIPLGENLSEKINEEMISGNDPRALVFRTTICGHAMIFKKNILLSTDDLTSAPYIDWMISFLAAGRGGIKYINDVLVDWRIHDSSVSDVVRHDTQASRRKRMATEKMNLKAFSAVSGNGQPFIQEAKMHWDAWENSFFSLSLFCFIHKNKILTHAPKKGRFPELKYFVGYKLRRFLRPGYY